MLWPGLDQRRSENSGEGRPQHPDAELRLGDGLARRSGYRNAPAEEVCRRGASCRSGCLGESRGGQINFEQAIEKGVVGLVADPGDGGGDPLVACVHITVAVGRALAPKLGKVDRTSRVR